MFQLIARHLLHTLNIIVVESFTTPHHYCPMSVQPLPALTVTRFLSFAHHTRGKEKTTKPLRFQGFSVELLGRFELPTSSLPRDF
jgi:hypothetical protein